MAQSEYINPLSNISYVNKDFQSIYPELLDLVKKISYKWDPTISDESDPGVILLKLCAIIADKNNFNIDSNTLECFPETVAQIYNARPLFEQLGYSMKWYMSAKTVVSMKWVGNIDKDNTSLSCSIPNFTMVSDSGNSIVFTLITDVQLPLNGNTVDVEALQGVITDYTVNGDTLITSSNLDSNNRLYFPDINVAENGIFINNYGVENYNDWKKVDNLSVEEFNSKVYKFGVSKDGSSCYIEFPEDIEDLIGQGINVKYILSNGYEGNIATSVLEQFYNEVIVTDPFDGTQTIILNSENVKITNSSYTTNGKDAESIDEAYNNYKKTIGVFNTLVSCHDYESYINRLNKVSNCVVSDRTDDIQCSYHVMSESSGINRRILQVARKLIESITLGGGESLNGIIPSKLSEDTSEIREVLKASKQDVTDTEIEADKDKGILQAQLTEESRSFDIYEDKMLAFDLKLYALQWADVTNNYLYYNSTFNIIPYAEFHKDIYTVEQEIVDSEYGDLSEVKCVQHNFKYHENDKICILKNKYPIIAKIIPQYKLTDLQRSDVEDNIKIALYNALNSRQISFGESINYDKVFDTITGADERIKSISLDTIDYTTYAVYFDAESKENQYKEVAISDGFEKEYITGKYDENAPHHFILDDPKKEFNSSYLYIDTKSYASDISEEDVSIYNDIVPMEISEDNLSKTDKNEKPLSETINPFNYAIRDLESDLLNNNKKIGINSARITKDESYVEPGVYGYISNFVYRYNPKTKNVELYSSKINEFREEIYAKSVLNGNTQLLLPDDTYTYSLDQVAENIITDVTKLSTSVKIDAQNTSNVSLTNVKFDTVNIEEGRYEATIENPEYISNGSLTLQLSVINSSGTEEILQIYSSYDTDNSSIIRKESSRLYTYDSNIDVGMLSYQNGTSPNLILQLTGYTPNSTDADGNLIINTVNYKKIEKISTTAPATYALRDNETIQIYAPSLITEETYANYVKYQYQINNDSDDHRVIPANTEYKLRENESITFYWREDDDSDYSYHKYGAGTIIKASFALKYENISKTERRTEGEDIYVSYYVGQELSNGEGIVPDTSRTFYLKNVLTSYTLNEYIATLIEDKYVLSGTQSIEERVINSVSIKNSSPNCYWILNTITSNDTYMLFPKYDAKLDNYQESTQYILKTGEYFIYPNASNTSLVVLGAGTKIDRRKTGGSTELPAWEVSALEYDDIIVNGNSFLTDMWFTIPSNVEVFATEMQYYTFGAGTTVQFLLNSKAESCTSVSFDENGYVIYDITTSDGKAYHDYSDTEKRELTLSDFTIKYRDVDSSTFSTVPTIDIGDITSQLSSTATRNYTETSGWGGNSVYSIDCSSDRSQRILSRQSIRWIAGSDESDEITNGIVYGDDNNPTYVKSGQILTIEGGTNIDVTTIDSSGDIIPASLYFYKLNRSIDEEITQTSNSTSLKYVNSGESAKQETKTFSCKLPDGTYIIPFKVPSTGVESVSIQLNGENLSPINADKIDVKKSNIFYLAVNSIVGEQLDFDVTVIVEGKSTITVQFGNVFKYTTTSDSDSSIILTDGDFYRLLQKVKELDVNNKYNYTYVVDKDEEIKNPLNAESFLDSNHIFNKFTICQMNTGTTDIYITNKIK